MIEDEMDNITDTGQMKSTKGKTEDLGLKHEVSSSTSVKRTIEDDSQTKPRKKKISKFHRTHAHRNPLSDGFWEYPVSPDVADWHTHYPAYFPELTDNPTPISMDSKLVEFADIGCGYGGLLVSLGEKFPENIILGIEIRTKVVEYVQQRIVRLREENKNSMLYQNISVLNTNAMKYLPNFFFKGQLKKLFFLFPDPHFKKSNYKRRIISPALLAEYAYVLALGGLLYTVTDVKELYEWEVGHLNAHPLFQQLPLVEAEADPVVAMILNSSEEAKKVDKAKGQKYFAVYRRVACGVKEENKNGGGAILDGSEIVFEETKT